MKLAIEITEDEIKSAIERKVRVAIADETNSWRGEKQLKEEVKKQFEVVLSKIVADEVSKAPVLREKIRAMIEAKLKGQINSLMKEKK